ncbi:MAG: hypothetical protein JRG96_07060 [Deltaproteobacteria bacterium]|nr:hypothetical protein [Deltaproteobacteria bacterium]
MAAKSAERGEAPAKQPKRLLGVADAVERLETSILAQAPAHDCAAAEGLALAGVRAASVSEGAPGELLGEDRAWLESSCVHHLWMEPGASSRGAFEFAAASAEDALEHCVAAHLLSAWLGRAGVCSVAPALAEGLSLVELPEAAAVERLLRAEAPLLREVVEGESVESEGVEGERVEGERVGSESVGADDAQELAAAALGLAAGGEGCVRPVLVDIEGSAVGADAEVVLVAAGLQSSVARDAARCLVGAGLPATALSVVLVRPFPAAALRSALAGARRVHVLHAEGTPCALLERVRANAPEGCELRPLAASTPVAALEALASALPDPAGAFESAVRAASSAEQRLTHRLVVAPTGSWGRDAAGRVLSALAERRPLRVDRRSRAHLGARVLAWDEAGSPSCKADKAERDLLIVAGPSLLEPRGALALLRPGSAVLLPAAAHSSRELAGLFSVEIRQLLRERNHEIYWVDAAGSGMQASELLAAAAVAVIVNPEEPARAAELTGGADLWLEAGSKAIRRLRREDLAEDALPEEVDFRSRSPLPRMPRAVDAPVAREQWAERLHRFHTRGPGEFAPAPQPLLRPLVFEQLAGRSGASASHPFVLVAADKAGPPLVARGFAELLGEAIEAGAEAGHAPGVLERNLDSLTAGVAHRLAERGEPGELRELVASAGEELGRSLELAEPERFAAELAGVGEQLAAGAQVLDLRADTALRLYLALQSAVNTPLRRRFGARLVKLRDRLRDLLELDHRSSEEGRATDAVAASLGDAGSQYLDPATLARSLPEPASGAQLDEQRHRRIEDALARIEEYLAVEEQLQEVVFLHAPGHRLHIPDLQRRIHPDPLAAAVGYFDGVARRMSGLFRAIRVAELEAEGAWRAELHEAALADLSWEAFTAEELALVPRVAVVTTGRQLRSRGQDSLSELLRSSRPVHVLVQDEVAAGDEARDFSAYHLDLGGLVMAHREVFALSSSLARPDTLCERFARMARAPRPAVALLQQPAPELAHLRPLLAEAALEGRACADFLYDPDAGASWADRLDIAGSPQPEHPWPLHRVPVLDADANETTLELAFTFADAVALDPAYAAHLHAIPAEAWDDEQQLPLAGYLERFDPEGVPRGVPFIWCVDESGVLQRSVVTRELALASRDRLRGWRVLQELAGFENAHAERAAEAAREAALADAAREREILEQRYSEALAAAREAGARESMERLAAVLTIPGGIEAAAGVAEESLTAAATIAAGVPEATPAPVDQAAREGLASQEEEQQEDQEEDDGLSFDEPYIDVPLCTTCNECTNINSRLFQYNEDKQAFIADASAGSFADLVTSAEKCPAKCIHPGKPRTDDASATPQMLERAAKFN